MNESLPPSLPLPPGRRRGLGCFAKGCLTTITALMFIGVGIGAFGWYLYKSGQAYFTEKQVPTRVLEVTDDQYQAVLARLQPFGEAASQGRAATVELTAADLNTLIAREPGFASLRGQTFLDLVKGQLVADLSFPASQDVNPSPYFINAHATLDASFAGGRFTFALRRVRPLRGEANEGLLPSLLRNPTFLQNYSQMLNRDFNNLLRDEARKEPRFAAVLAVVRTIVIQDDKLVVTSLERPDPSTPAASPVANTPP